MITKKEHHALICSTLTDIYERKNHDYGDSFAQLRTRQPNAILVRLYDKYLRLETLLSGAMPKVKDESIDDTLMDMANYCIMELVERQIEREVEESKKCQGCISVNPTPDKPEPWGMEDERRKFKYFCTQVACSDCKIGVMTDKAKMPVCTEWCKAHPAEARKIMDEWEAEHGVD